MPPPRPDPTRRDLVVFGVGLPIFTLLLGGMLSRLTGASLAGRAVWVAGGLLSVVFLAVPARRRAIYAGWMRATYPLGWLVTHVLLTAVFVAVITPLALLMKLLRIDPLNRRFDSSAATYWTSRDPDTELRSYFRQY